MNVRFAVLFVILGAASRPAAAALRSMPVARTPLVRAGAPAPSAGLAVLPAASLSMPSAPGVPLLAPAPALDGSAQVLKAPEASAAQPAEAGVATGLETLGAALSAVHAGSDESAAIGNEAFDSAGRNTGAALPGVLAAASPKTSWLGKASGNERGSTAGSKEPSGPRQEGPADRIYRKLVGFLERERRSPLSQAELKKLEDAMAPLLDNELASSYKTQGLLMRVVLDIREALQANPAGRDISSVVKRAEEVYAYFDWQFDDWKVHGLFMAGGAAVGVWLGTLWALSFLPAVALAASGALGLAAARKLSQYYYRQEKAPLPLAMVVLLMRIASLGAATSGVTALVRLLIG